MAEKLHVDEGNYKRIENGEKKTMDLELLGRIAEALGTEWTDLVTGDYIHFENKAETLNDHAAINGCYRYEVINNGVNIEMKEVYDQLINQLQQVIEEKNKTIALLMELKEKK